MSQVLSESKDHGFVSIFDWINRAKRPFWFIFFGFISLVAHIACFYLFSIVYPDQKRSTLKPMEITVLDLDNPKSKSIMNQIDDRLIVLDQNVDSVTAINYLPESDIRFEPFFQDYSPKLKDFVAKANKPEESLIDFTQFQLPPVNGSNLTGKNIQLNKNEEPDIVFIWESESREIIKDFNWSKNQELISGNIEAQLVIQIGINRFGVITHFFPEKSLSQGFENKVIKALKEMRFSKATSEMISWATVEISW